MYCANHLLKENDFISEVDRLESLCKLLKSLGEMLSKDKDHLSYIVKQLRTIKEERGQEVGSRIRFMIQDVLELSNNNWRTPHPNSNKSRLKSSKTRSGLSQSAANIPNSPNRRVSAPVNKRGGKTGWGRNSSGFVFISILFFL